jgi:hypothetical protein
MARMEALHCPFASKVHPDASLAQEASVQWAQAMGMLPTEQHVRGAQNAKVGWLVARGFPTASRDGLQLVADWTLWFCMLDDHIEELHCADLDGYLGRMLEILHSDDVIAKDSFEVALGDLRRRVGALPTGTLERFREAVAELFAGFAQEAREHARGLVPPVATYLELREVTVGLKVILTLAEAVEAIDLPDDVLRHPAIRQLATRTCNIVGWSNDLFTYEKEMIQGEIHNLVMAVMIEDGKTLAEAVTVTVQRHDREVCGFIQDVELLPCFGAADPEVRRYVEMLRCWIRGHLDWARETGRYQPSGVPSATQRPLVIGEDETELAALAAGSWPWPRSALAGSPAHPAGGASPTLADDEPRGYRARGREWPRGTADVAARMARSGVGEGEAAPEHRSEGRELPRGRHDSDRHQIDIES